MHYHRAEHWVVVGGTALVHKGHDKDNLTSHLLRENDRAIALQKVKEGVKYSNRSIRGSYYAQRSKRVLCQTQ